MKLPKGVTVFEHSVTMYQEADTWSPEQRGQSIKITAIGEEEDRFLYFETGRWAIDEDEIELFTDVLKEVCKFPDLEKRRK